jgi:hypothetical protein
MPYVKRVPGLDGTVSCDMLEVPGYATYQIVTDLDGNRREHDWEKAQRSTASPFASSRTSSMPREQDVK